MKKILALALVLVISLSLSGCMAVSEEQYESNLMKEYDKGYKAGVEEGKSKGRKEVYEDEYFIGDIEDSAKYELAVEVLDEGEILLMLDNEFPKLRAFLTSGRDIEGAIDAYNAIYDSYLTILEIVGNEVYK